MHKHNSGVFHQIVCSSLVALFCSDHTKKIMLPAELVNTLQSWLIKFWRTATYGNYFYGLPLK